LDLSVTAALAAAVRVVSQVLLQQVSLELRTPAAVAVDVEEPQVVQVALAV
jgi:hypothetical protein